MRRFLVCFGLVLLASGSGSGAGTEEEDSFLDLSDLDAVVGTDGDVVVFDGVALEDDLGMDEDQSFTYSRPRDSMDLYEGRDIEYDQAVNRPMNLALGVVYAIITVVGLIANCIVFFVIFAGRETSKTVTALYILQLAIADSIFLLTLPIFAAQKVAMHWAFGRSTCALCHTVKFVNYYAGIFFLTAMSVDRYIAVAYSTKSHQLRTKKRTLVVCVIVWCTSIIMSIPVMLYAKTEKVNALTFCRLMFPGYKAYDPNDSSILVYYDDFYDNGDNATNSTWSNTFPHQNDSQDMNQTNFDIFGEENAVQPEIAQPPPPSNKFLCSHDDQSTMYKAWIVINSVVGFLVPFSIIYMVNSNVLFAAISYILILKHLRMSENRVASLAVKKSASMRKRVTRMVAILVLCFMICWLPYNIFNLMRIPGIDVSATGCFGTEQFLVALGFSNSAINPILYSFLGHSFRARLRESITATRRRLRRNSSLPTGVAQGHGAGTHTHSDHTHTSFKKRLSSIVAAHRIGRTGSVSKDNERHGSSSGLSTMEGRRQRCSIPLLDMNKKKVGWNSDNHTEDQNYTTRTNGVATEVTRVMLNDKDVSIVLDKDVTA